MNASPTPPEFSWELDQGFLFIQFTNSDGGQSTALIGDPQLMRRIGELCLERGRGGPQASTLPADGTATTIVAGSEPTATAAASGDDTAGDPVVTIGPAGKLGLFLQFTNDDTSSELILGNPQRIRDVALVFLHAAGICTEIRTHGLDDGDSSVLYSGEYFPLEDNGM